MSSTFLSIIVCTRNRAHMIGDCLREAARQAKEFPDVEVIVVDNASTDNTREVVNTIIVEHGEYIRYVYEPMSGSSRARNRGRREARGRIIGYIDDDEIARPGWVEGVREHFLAKKSDCLCGKYELVIKGELPEGLTSDLFWILGETSLGDEARYLTFPECPQAGNCAMRVEVFDAVGGFDPALTLYGDDTELFQRISQLNFTTMYDPRLVIDQIVPEQRLAKSALRHKAYIWGRGSAMVWLLSAPGFIQRWGKATEYALRALYVGCRWCISPTFGRYFTFWHDCGRLRQLISGIGQPRSS